MINMPQWSPAPRASRNTLVILSAALLLLSVSSCDFFRSLAGRPGSEQIRQKRELIERAEACRDSLERALLDSVARSERYAADSLYAVDTLTRSGKLRMASAIRSIPGKNLRHRYNIVVGAFSQPANAERLAGRFKAAGFEAEIFRYYGGMNAVFVAPCDRITEAMEAYRAVARLPFASDQTWILVND